MNLTLSDTAYSQIGHLLKEHDKKFVRLQVKGGGCAGFEYQWSFENEKGTDDVVIDDRVLVCLLYTSPSPRDSDSSRMPSSA